MNKYVPGLVIGGGALVVIYFLSKGGKTSPIVSNALVPSSNPTPVPSRDPARVAAFGDLASVALGKQRLQEQSQAISSQLELGRFRLQEQSKIADAALASQRYSTDAALALQREQIAGNLESQRINANAAQNMQTAALTDRNYDRELQRHLPA